MSWQGIDIAPGEVKKVSYIIAMDSASVLEPNLIEKGTFTKPQKTAPIAVNEVQLDKPQIDTEKPNDADKIHIKTQENITYVLTDKNKQALAEFAATDDSGHSFIDLLQDQKYFVYAKPTSVELPDVDDAETPVYTISEYLEVTTAANVPAISLTEAGKILVENNGSRLSKIVYKYTRQDVLDNPTLADIPGYKKAQVNDIEANEDITVTPYEGGGNYSVIAYYVNGRSVTQNIFVPFPNIDVGTAGFTITDDGSGLDSITYAYVGPPEIVSTPATTLQGIIAKGKAYPNINTSTGYTKIENIEGVDTEVAVNTKGSYFIYATYKGMNTTFAALIDDENLVESGKVKFVSFEDGVITLDAADSGAPKAYYEFTGAEEKPYADFNKFIVNGKAFVAENGDKGYKEALPNESGIISIRTLYPGYYTIYAPHGDGRYEAFTQKVEEGETAPILITDIYPLGIPYMGEMASGATTVVDNQSGVSKIYYQYTGLAESPYTTWLDFVNTGKRDTAVNGKGGYNSVAADDIGGIETSVKLYDSGYYTFYVTYGEGKYKTFTFYVNPTEVYVKTLAEQFANKPYVDGLEDGKLRIRPNTTTVTKLYYQFTGDTEKPYTDWNTFAQNGKATEELAEINTSKGSRFIENPAIDNDAHRVTLYHPGWYTVYMAYSTGEGETLKSTTTAYTVFVTPDEVTPMPLNPIGKPYILKDEVGNPSIIDSQFTVVDNDSGVAKVLYQYTGETEVPYTTWVNFTSTGKTNLLENSTLGYRTATVAGPEVYVPAYDVGWYTFYVTYDTTKIITFTAHASELDVTRERPFNDDTTVDGIPSLAAAVFGAEVTSNNSGLAKIQYQYTGDKRVPYDGNWSNFLATGKQNTLVNTISGYKTVDFATPATTVSVNLFEDGWYTFLLGYIGGDGKPVTKSVELKALPDAVAPKTHENLYPTGTPYLSHAAGNLTLVNNASGATKVTYAYTGDEEVHYNGKLADLQAVGKNFADINSTAGSRSISFPSTDDAAMRVHTAGWYTAIVTSPTKTWVYTYHLGSAHVVGLSKAELSPNAPYLSEIIDGNATVTNNNSSILKVYYQYTGATEKPYTDWSSFVATGRANVGNPVAGYVLNEPGNGDNVDVSFPREGDYTFYITYKSGTSPTTKVKTFTVEIGADQKAEMVYANGIPYIGEITGNVIPVVKNDADITKITYQYTGATRVPYNAVWNDFVATGKAQGQINSASGYKVTPTIDATTNITAEAFGWYTILITANGKTYNYEVELADGFVPMQLPTITTDGANITYTEYDNSANYGDNGTITKIVYTPPVGKATILSESLTLPVTFTTPRPGQYSVAVTNSAKGAYTHVVNVAEKIAYGATLMIDGSEIKINAPNGRTIVNAEFVLGSAPSKDAFYALYDAPDAVKGAASENKVKVSNLGMYSIRATDDAGNTYYLQANIKTLQGASVLNYNDLDATILNAQELTSTTVSADGEGLEAGVKYVSQPTLNTLNKAITTAQTARGAAKTQTDVEIANLTLKSAVSAFQTKVTTVPPQLVSVDGSTINVTVDNAEDLEKIVEMLTDDKTAIRQATVDNWTAFAKSPYKKLNKGVTSIENVPNGVYTLLVRTKINGVGTDFYKQAIVAVDDTEINVAKTYLSGLLTDADTTIGAMKLEADAADGESYVTKAAYDSFNKAIRDGYAILDNDFAQSKDVISACLALTKQKSSAQASEKQKVAPVVVPDVVITQELAEDEKTVNITVSRENLKDVLLTKGAYTTWVTFGATPYTQHVAKTGTTTLSVAANGEYTMLIRYTDGTQKYQPVSVTEIPAEFGLSQADAQINVQLPEGKTVESVGISYGTTFDSSGSSFIHVAPTEGETEVSLDAFGNGTHTIYVKVAGEETVYKTIEVDSCEGPVVLVDNDKGYYGAFTHGFDVTVAAYAMGTFDNWNDMHETAVYTACNSMIDSESLEAGNYTFYFKTATDEYFVTVPIGMQAQGFVSSQAMQQTIIEENMETQDETIIAEDNGNTTNDDETTIVDDSGDNGDNTDDGSQSSSEDGGSTTTDSGDAGMTTSADDGGDTTVETEIAA